MTSRQVFIVGGPTASGKSALALALAEKLGGEIINADSLQLYDGLPLLTAQPSAAEKSSAPHHLYACLGIDDKTSAADWRNKAAGAITDILSRGRTPIVVGGTGFYLMALMEGLSPIPAITPDARQQAQHFLDTHGTEGLFAEIKRLDPQGAPLLDAHNPRRLVRAYEVYLGTGKPLSYWQQQPRETPPAEWQFVKTVIDPPRDVLHARCDGRFLQMVDHGVLDEVKNIMDVLPPDAALSHACGFSALCDHLRGSISFDEAISLSQADTRQYAKRQATWFRNQMGDAVRVKGADSKDIQAVLSAKA